ncbi:diaminopimelate decarboxylase family protein [Dactylosporangium sp. CA-139066]|uniref:diaminopimelate decarboxylase family protein n=1 Tax=Dactylosporangium sp. CA-139066 TaxID=3239930 RepID=UPI003D8C2B42
MTLADILPSLRSSLPAHLEPGAWPPAARWGGRGELLVAGAGLAALAEAHGTPLYVLDEAAVRERCRAYAAAFGAENVAYTGKALLTAGVAGWVAAEGLGLYAGSAGEIRVALAGGVDPSRIVLYGSAKTPEDLAVARAAGVGAIVVESLSEITRLAATAPAGQRVLLRLLAGPAEGEAFGLRVGTGEAATAVARIAGQPGLRLAGLDCSVGHEIERFQRYETELRRIAEFSAHIHRAHGAAVGWVDLGGGHTDHDFALEAFAGRMRAMMTLESERRGVPAPRLGVSPGRAVVGRAGVTVYRILSVTARRDGRLLVATDGGMTDCPAAQCADRHTAVLVGRASVAPPVPATVLGRHNDPGDFVVPRLELPADVHPGDLLAVAGTGAYHHARASNFHLVPHPALLAVSAGRARTLLRRESIDDLLAREC